MSSTTSSSINTLSNSIRNSLSTPSISNISSSMLSNTSIKENLEAIFNSTYIYIGLIIVIIVCVLLAWTLYYIISSRIFALTKVVSEDTYNPILTNTKRKFNFIFDKSSNGERRSFTFWIYIHDLNVGRDTYKNVFYISDTKNYTNIGSLSPYVFMDKIQNRLYVRFAKQASEDDSTKEIKYSDLNDKTKFADFMKTGIVIPYVPLQRWVHIAVVCNANSYKNYIYAYVDGDLVNSTSTGEIDKIASVSNDEKQKKDLKNLDLNVQGYLTIGGTPNDFAEGPGFSGLITKITAYNHEINQQDIYNDYYNGPIGGILASIGLANYGLRSPIYKIS